MYSIKKSDCKFFVNSEKKTITCVCNYNVAERIETEVNRIHEANFNGERFNASIGWFDMPSMMSSKFNRTYVGISKCGPEDTFSIEVGCELAFARMIEKIDNDYFHVMHGLIDEYNKLGNLYSQYVCKQVDKSDNTMSQREQKLQALLEEKGISVPYYNDDDIFGGIE